MPRCLTISCLLLSASSWAVAASTPELPYTLPTRFDANRIFVQPVTDTGIRLSLYTDTGGGLFLSTHAAEKLGADYSQSPENSSEDGVPLTRWPNFRTDAWIPQPARTGAGIPVREVPAPFADNMQDGMLGAWWFADRCWEFDYPRQSLRLLECGSLPKVAAEHRVPLHFQVDETGKHTTAFPRISVEIDGEPLELLFDTGAMSTFTEAAVAQIADSEPATRAVSLITQTVAARWRERHPEWPWIDAGEQGTGMALVQADNVRVAGYDSGPLWFAVRPDANFHVFMSQWMDTRVEGALGGNALRRFRVTVDYRQGAATFERSPGEVH